jgi:hypothetical protein
MSFASKFVMLGRNQSEAAQREIRMGAPVTVSICEGSRTK